MDPVARETMFQNPVVSLSVSIVTINSVIMAEITSSVNPSLRIGTRRSNLAVVQAEGIRDSLQKIAPNQLFEIEAIRTLGDRDKLTALYEFGAKNLWTSELEERLTCGELDLIVHCLKGK